MRNAIDRFTARADKMISMPRTPDQRYRAHLLFLEIQRTYALHDDVQSEAPMCATALFKLARLQRLIYLWARW